MKTKKEKEVAQLSGSTMITSSENKESLFNQIDGEELISINCKDIDIIKKETNALDVIMNLGSVFVKSGMFPDLKSQAQAVVEILAGKELGLSPLESITNLYIVNGKVACQSK